MYQRDFLLRMIEMFGEMIAGILGLIKKGDLPKASERLEGAYFDFLKEDAAYFRTLPIKDLTQNLLVQHNYTNDHLEVLAGLFLTEAELLFVKEDWTECKLYLQKAQTILLFVDENSRSYSLARKQKNEYIVDLLNRVG